MQCGPITGDGSLLARQDGQTGYLQDCTVYQTRRALFWVRVFVVVARNGVST